MFEIKPKIIYDTKRQKGMNSIHDNKVNSIAKWNLLYDILNSSKRNINIDRHYYPIIHVCINTQNIKENLKNYWILLDSGCVIPESRLRVKPDILISIHGPSPV